MVNVILEGAKKHCWNIIRKDDKFMALSPDNNTQYSSKDFIDAIEWCNMSFNEIPNEFKLLVEKKKKELVKSHLSEFNTHYKNVYRISGIFGLSKEVYDFTEEYNTIRNELELEHSRKDYDYISNVLKTSIINKMTYPKITFTS